MLEIGDAVVDGVDYSSTQLRCQQALLDSCKFRKFKEKEIDPAEQALMDTKGKGAGKKGKKGKKGATAAAVGD